MITYLYHDSLNAELKKASKKHRSVFEAFESFERLCEKQFHPLNPQQVISPAKLHRVTQNGLWALWKNELIIPNSGLRPNQFPRIWFVVKGAIIAFLCIGFHGDNYDDGEKCSLALERIDDIF